MAYRIEQANTKRAICKNTECKKAGVKIDKGELRLGSWVDYGEHQGWAWKHWGCVTPVQIESLKTALDDDVSMLDGYEELPDDLREKVKLALQNGHITDEDWKGDIEQNRPGKRGFRSPAPRKPKKSSKKHAEEEGPGEENDKKNLSKLAPKKRGRAKKEDVEEESIEEPVKKKAKPTARKAKMIKDEGSTDVVTVDDQATEPNKATAKNANKPKGKKSEPEDAVKPKPKAAIQKAKVANKEATVDDIKVTTTPSKKPKAAGKKNKKTAVDDGVEAGEAAVEPEKVAGRPRKAKVEDIENEGPAGEHTDRPPKPIKKSATTKNAANTKKPIAKKAENMGVANASEAAGEDAPKAKRGRKKADSLKTKSS
ncbi:MAG: hypothetical protein Q9216_000011 [Gyalolechia sp. 2 TL-2023]